ncbi:hypothetical protein PG994_008625 [Apiospora phragmitis]|uniref:Uncharacterized protein n=1 Tax=Apiospora phragmitis TaxID=2905665 RepID=A0ABR1UHJ3_9PEZI
MSATQEADPDIDLMYSEHIDNFLSTPGSKVAFIEGHSGTGKSARAVPDLWMRCRNRNLPFICLQPSYATANSVCEAYQSRKDKPTAPAWMMANGNSNVQFGYNAKSRATQHYIARDFCCDYQDLDRWAASGCTEMAIVLDNMAPAQTYWDILCFEQVRLWMEALQKGNPTMSLTLFIMVSTPIDHREVISLEDFPGAIVMQWNKEWQPGRNIFEMEPNENPESITPMYRKINAVCQKSASVVFMASRGCGSVMLEELNKSESDISVCYREESITSNDITHQFLTVPRKDRQVLIAFDEMRFVDKPLDRCCAIICSAKVSQWRQDEDSTRFMPMDTVVHMNDIRGAVRLAYMAYYQDNAIQPEILVEAHKPEDGQESTAP